MTAVDSAELAVEGPWQHRFVAANGARFHVAVSGPDDRDAPLVVLLHDLLQYWWAWRHQLTALAEAGYRVAAMDLRGTGGSDKPPHGYDTPTMATDVARVIRSLGADRCVLVGSGTGAQVAWATAAMHDDVVRAVGALAAAHPLDSVFAPIHPGAARRIALALVPSVPERRLADALVVRRLLTAGAGARGWPDRETSERYARALRVPFAAHSQLEQLRWLVRSRPRPDGRRYLGAFEHARPVPTLQVHGDRDGVRSPTAAAMHGRTRRLADPYRWELLAGVGHYPAEEAPELLNALLLDWLAETLTA
ncbi:MAG: alpha/beta hydrolase [Cellulomonas sp. 73-92]|uniref:alpha/beta fold hydrolase n=1 Tax=Cellulomonas sp. 73-92 TaxID=1895740 RepID=UPI00092A538D|nr:alpha/beta fold hydrolase [Cellulomonas sp. 73-92]OJV81145.1 MAG: alpha/beta hydrolase [Cellulomonas sp. 73-92]